MKKILGILLAVLVVVAAAVVIVPFLIPAETYREELRNQVRNATGRELTIAGDISLTILPRTQLVAEQVSFSNADWAEPEEMARLERLQVRVNPWALLSGEVEVESFVLDEPIIHLVVDEQGRGNWEFEDAPEDVPEEPDEPRDPAERRLPDIRLGEVRLENGTVTYTDMATGERQEVSEVSATLDLETLDAPLSADGALRWNGERVEIALNSGPPRALLAGDATPIRLSVDSLPLRLDYDGRIVLAEENRLEGAVEIDVPSLKGLAAWAGEEIEAAEGTLEAFNLAGRLEAVGDNYSFTAESLRLDEITGSGGLDVNLAGEKPRLSGRLDLSQMDLTPYLPEPVEATDDAAAEVEAEAAVAEWSEEPLDLSGLHAADAQFDLSVEGITARDVTIGRSALGLVLEDGRLEADLQELNLYDGFGSGRVVLNARDERPSMALRLALEEVQSNPLLSDVADFERLEGRGAMSLDVTADGQSQREMVETLNGSGAISFTDGAIVGINLAQMARNVTAAFQDTGEAESTDFAELAGTFTIENGILRNDDLALLNPLLRVTGAGTADIPARTVDYRITPRAVASLEGQGGDLARRGIAVPIVVTGPWHDLSFRPDLESLVRDAVRDPEAVRDAAEDAIRGIREASPDGLRGVLEELTGRAEEEGEDAPRPEEGLRGILEGLTGGGSAPEAEPEEAPEAADEGERPDPLQRLRGILGD